MAAQLSETDGMVGCWCCGKQVRHDLTVRLGNHPEVAVCLGCAHYLHRQAWSREDSRRRSIGSALRNGLRSGRGVVLQRRWHEKAVVGDGLRWLGRHMP